MSSRLPSFPAFLKAPPGYTNAQQQGANRVYVFQLCFDRQLGAMSNVFCHELGHVLGIRHEFPSREELTSLPSWHLGPKDRRSVMRNWGDNWSRCRISSLDEEWVRHFYSINQLHSGEIIHEVIPRRVLEPEV